VDSGEFFVVNLTAQGQLTLTSFLENYTYETVCFCFVSLSQLIYVPTTMFKVGITGNIGSGKTTVCKIFEVLGIPVFYADDEGKKVMIEDDVLIAGIKQAFGTEAYFADGNLNRKHIAGIVFNDKEELLKLNALVHPAVFRAFDKWVINQKNVPYVLKEAALLFESDSYKMCDRSVLVTAPLDIRIQRVTQRDGITADEVKSRNEPPV
jgi:dephospho-CoA kinase